MYISYTRFRVKKWWALPLFQWHAMRSHNQASKSKGINKMQTFYAGGMDFCTLTSWESKEQMLKFRNSGAHLIAMKLSSKMGLGYSVGWESEDYGSQQEGEERLLEKLLGMGLFNWIPS